ncbi:unnamed protein product [Urochloa humidicola]
MSDLGVIPNSPSPPATAIPAPAYPAATPGLTVTGSKSRRVLVVRLPRFGIARRLGFVPLSWSPASPASSAHRLCFFATGH